MTDRRAEPCAKDECSELIKELAELRLQLKDAESQIGILEGRDQSLSSNVNQPHKLEDNSSFNGVTGAQFDLGNTDNRFEADSFVQSAPSKESAYKQNIELGSIDQKAAVSSVPGKRDQFIHHAFQNDKQLFLNAIDKWILTNKSQGYSSGALVICEFVPVEKTIGLKASEQRNNMRGFDSVIHSVTQTGDFVAYLSQYERMFFIPFDIDGESAVRAAKRIIRFANEESRACLDKNIIQKCSLGIASFPNDACDADTLFRYADRALYNSLKIDDSYYSFYR